MKRASLLSGVTLALGIALGVTGTSVLNAEQEPVKRTVLLITDLADIKDKEGLVVFAEIAPGAATGKHIHSGDEFAYVLEGSGILEIEGKPPVTLEPGVVVHQPPNQGHNGKNSSQTAPLRILAFYLPKKGEADTVPVK